MAAYFRPMASQTKTSPGPQDPIAWYSGDSSPLFVSAIRSGRGGMKRSVLARPTSDAPGVKLLTPLMKHGS